MFRKYMAALLLLPILSAAACVSASAGEHPDAGGAAVPCPPGYGPQIPGGRELQELRDSMKEKLSQVSDRLRTETGLDLRVPDTRGCRSMQRVYMRGRIHGHE